MDALPPRQKKKTNTKASPRPAEPKPEGNEKVANWGLGLIGIGLLGLLLPLFGLQLRRLQALGDAQWIVLAMVVAVGCVALLWGGRDRLAFAGSVSGGALVLIPVLAWLSFWRHSPKSEETPGGAPGIVGAASQGVQQPAPGSGQQPGTSFAPPAGQLHRLQIEISGAVSPDVFTLLCEFIKDAVPDATSFSTRYRSSANGPTVQEVTIGPVSDAEKLPARITVGKAAMTGSDRMQIRVRLPLPPAAESVRNRVDRALEGLRSDDVARKRNAVMMLGSLAPLSRREEVAAELLALQSQQNPPVSAAEPLKKWGVATQVPALLDLVGKEGINQAEILEILVVLSPEDAVLAAIDSMNRDEGLARHILTKIGAPAEAEILRMIPDAQKSARRSYCEILQTIGTDKSLDAMSALTEDPDRGTAEAARRAVEAIRARAKKNGS